MSIKEQQNAEHIKAQAELFQTMNQTIAQLRLINCSIIIKF